VIGDFIFGQIMNINLKLDGIQCGIWEGFIPNIEKGTTYKYKIESNNGGISKKQIHLLLL
jgi:1,4-alpha-glucan branching enzyme